VCCAPYFFFASEVATLLVFRRLARAHCQLGRGRRGSRSGGLHASGRLLDAPDAMDLESQGEEGG
jgi:hypothetical protein